MLNLIQRFLVNENGPTAVEYAVMLALIVVGCVWTIWGLGRTTWFAFAWLQFLLSS